MGEQISDTDIESALAECAEEQIHIPGVIQPFACLVGLDVKTQRIVHASANIHSVLGKSYQSLIGQHVDAVFGPEVLHGLRNALTRTDIGRKALFVGEYQIADQDCALHVFESGDCVVLEIEVLPPSTLSRSDDLKTFGFLVDNIEDCTTEQQLFEQITRVLRHLSGFDRVMVYRFDDAWNGEILAEDRRSALQSFLGLRFPHWDIPAQARAMMEKAPLRFIHDSDQVPVALHSGPDTQHPLDISFAFSRGASVLHLEYLRNMRVAATMTLSIKVAGKLWGIISFHHMSPRTPAPKLRELLIQVGRVFSVKLNVLQQQSQLALVSRIDALTEKVRRDLGADGGIVSLTEAVMEILDANGLCILDGGQEHTIGSSPSPSILAQINQRVKTDGEVLCFDSLSAEFDTEGQELNDCAGAIVFAHSYEHRLLVFRPELAQEVHWAGNPEKRIEAQSGRLRLSPRGSFSTYLEQVKGRAKPWTDQDSYFASRIWSLIDTVERRELILTLNRQQKLLIDELNHRVRNILSLIRSVSEQARNSSSGSLGSYSRSLEARIQALAASHDLASASVGSPVSISDLIRKEVSPYLTGADTRFLLQGESKAMRPEMAPIFALVIHELLTNAVKYGAFSTKEGKIEVTLVHKPEGGMLVAWRERGGPPVVEPNAFGFGTTLIRQAVPYELSGRAEHRFMPEGVEAEFYLPEVLFDLSKKIDSDFEQAHRLRDVEDEKEVLSRIDGASCLVVEDNFLIAKETKDLLMSFGMESVETVGNVSDALDYLGDTRPTMAVLDVNLGNGEMSTLVAERLQDTGIPFFFATGYADNTQVDAKFRKTLRLIKPVTRQALIGAFATLLEQDHPEIG